MFPRTSSLGLRRCCHWDSVARMSGFWREGGLERLSAAVRVWAAACGLEAGWFRSLVVGPALGAEGAGGLQELGRLAAVASDATGVRAASGQLATVVAGAGAADWRYGLTYAAAKAGYAEARGLAPARVGFSAGTLSGAIATPRGGFGSPSGGAVEKVQWFLPFFTPKPPIVVRPSFPNGPGRLAPHPDAEGPHTTFKTDPKTGRVTKYEEYKPQANPNDPKPWESVRRYDDRGNGHFNKESGTRIYEPHVHDPSTPGGVRPALPHEIPK